MNSIGPEIQRALAECRKEMAASLCREQTLTEENEELKRQLLSQQNDAAASILALANDADLWRQECLKMQNSLSWKITKPLRLIKKGVHSLRTVGLKLTFLKVMKRRV